MPNIGQSYAGSALFWSNHLFDNGTIGMYSGTQPTSPETALSGNTLLAQWTYTATAFSAPSLSSGNEQTTANYSAASVAPAATGTVSFARGAPPAWAASTVYTVGQGVVLGGNIYQCSTAGTSAASGGPTGTGTAITDGTAVWRYLSSGPALIDYTVGTSGTDIVIGNTSIQTGTNVSLALTHKVPAV